jgi:hypothetical protein
MQEDAEYSVSESWQGDRSTGRVVQGRGPAQVLVISVTAPVSLTGLSRDRKVGWRSHRAGPRWEVFMQSWLPSWLDWKYSQPLGKWSLVGIPFSAREVT